MIKIVLLVVAIILFLLGNVLITEYASKLLSVFGCIFMLCAIYFFILACTVYSF